jgi:hydrogenase small subunit
MNTISRREALKRMYQVVVAVGASTFISFEDLVAADSKLVKPNIIWLHGSSCSGCSCSFLDVADVPVVDILTRFTNVIYHPDVSLATGKQVVDILDKSAKELKNNYLFVLEGGIPVDMPHACLMADRPMTQWIDQMMDGAIAGVGAGTCASFGGVTTMNGMVTGSMPLADYLSKKRVIKPVINLPNCPMKPEHIIYTILHYARFQTIPPLDKHARPKRFFARSIHERCYRYSDFQEKNFARKIGEEGCLYKLGCQGPVTKNDCLINGHNDNTNTCIKAGHPCIGCASEHFPRQIMFHSYNDDRAIVRFNNSYLMG